MSSEISNDQMFVTVALNAWDQWSTRAAKIFSSISDDHMLVRMEPGKNRPIYILGHLIAVNDALIPQLRLGEVTHPEYREIFITQPDGAVPQLPALAELRQNWIDVHQDLAQRLGELTPQQWLERHATVPEDEFAREPHRNRMALFHSRTAHLGYHIGQLLLFKNQWS